MLTVMISSICRCCKRYFSCSIQSPSFEYVILDPEAKVPQRSSPGAAAFDLYSPSDFYIPPHTTVKVPVGLSITPPNGTYARTCGRSGLAVNHQLFCPADVIDPDYTGSIHMCLTNMSNAAYIVKHHERIGAIVFEKHSLPIPVERSNLRKTIRGESGFGSTGKM